MFSRDKKPRRIHMMSLGVLNLPRLPVLDWAFGHSIISCHVEHHLFPRLSDNMCLKVAAGCTGGAGMKDLSGGQSRSNLQVHLNPRSPSGLVRGTLGGQLTVQAAVWLSDQTHLGFLLALRLWAS